ncbi:sporulation protein YqfD [Calderihabitans maritimus]|uniref:Thiol-disulfide isomerase and thioredoxins n=1 Tax=Calderihabitans maritimus TaxID=1246530 RepID=A0A1Z5HV99_9FIRM|nr:sporulation protein YqfD [Calderihabitans maritimus]GAW93442.1 thiol-disulfide isomerase and thioredoxins [Calderihabitans maritimus]
MRRLGAYLWGYLVILVHGGSPEKFINLTLNRGIRIWDLSWLEDHALLAKVPVAHFKPLRHVARKSGCRIRIRKKVGLPFLYWHFRKRKTLLLGPVLFLLFTYLLGSFVWTVEVSSQKELRYVKKNDILRVAEKQGLKPGTLKRNINIEAVAKAIEKSFPQISWVGVEIRGTRASIQVVEKVLLPKEEEEKIPSHLVAAKDGVITEILVLAGEARVTQGDTVKKGQLLISGVIHPEGPKSSLQYVRARGIVRARVWYTAEATAPLVKEEEYLSGRTARHLSIRTGGREIFLSGPRRIPFKNFEVEKEIKTWKWYGLKNFVIPAELVITTYHELVKKQSYLGPEGATRWATNKALARLEKQIPVGAKLLRKEVYPLGIVAPNMVGIKVMVETIEDIAVPQAIIGNN